MMVLVLPRRISIVSRTQDCFICKGLIIRDDSFGAASVSVFFFKAISILLLICCGKVNIC
uniref:Uncharacterized protein n=1 Tax=Kalanchoe fedtschenkoi TaxID=63787 RepID=A0A7N0VMV4_KALFE